MNFSSKTVWITGASSGIGKALAIELAAQGAELILSSRRTEALEEVKTACLGAPNVHVLPLDLSKSDTMLAAVEKAYAFCPNGIDVLVNNGGISQRSLAIDTDLEVDRRVMEIDYFGTVALSKAILPRFVKQQRGHFVVITSLMGKFSSPLRSGYCGAKHALHGFFDALYLEHWKDQIAVTLVCPGFIRTEISKNALVGDGSKQETMDEATGGGLTPEQCAKKMAKAIHNRKHEVYIGKKEILAIYLKRYFPGILRRILKNAKVT